MTGGCCSSFLGPATRSIGTTDTEYSESPFHPIVNDDDVKYLLDHVSRYLEVGPLLALSTFAGLRALADTDSGSTASASREHLVQQIEPGYFQVAGGKLTTYRRIAADVSDQVARHLGHSGKSRTKHLLLAGAGGGRSQLGPLEQRYGTQSTIVKDAIWQVRDGERLLTDDRTQLGEVIYTIEHEAVASIADFALRRTRLALLSPDHGRTDAPAIADLMGSSLGWSEAEQRHHLELYESELVAEGL